MVQIKVEMKHREDLKRLHTATHIVNFCARKVLGNHVWQNGSNLKKEFGTLDITHYENITQEQLFEIEKLINETIFENKKVCIEELSRTDAEKKYGFVLYQGGAIPMKTLRVVSILNSDIEACGGIHMESTGGIGLIKIIESQKIQDGVVRLKYVIREYAQDYINEQQKLVNKLKNLYSVDKKTIIKTSEKFFNDWKEQKKKIEELKKNLLNVYVDFFSNSKENEFDIQGDFDMGFLMELFSRVKKKKKDTRNKKISEQFETNPDRLKIDSDKFIIATQNFKIKNSKKEIKKGEFSVYIK